MYCIHLGPGQLGLGLIVSHLVERAGLPVYLVGRPADDGVPEEQRTFLISEQAPGVPQRPVTVDGAGNPHTVADLPDHVLARIRSREPLLITSALDKYAPSRMAFVDELVGERPDGAETILVVCENSPHACYEELAARHPGVLTVCPSVVDRVCTVREGAERDAEGRRQVEVHPVHEWVIGERGATRSAVLHHLRQHGVRVVEDIEPWHARKIWFVNGLHQVLALVARLRGLGRLDQAAATGPFERQAAPIRDAFAAAHAAAYPEFAFDAAYAADRARVFREMEDHTHRILEKHLVRADLRGLIARLDERVFSGAQVAAEHGVDCSAFGAFLELVFGVLRRPHLFYPAPGGAAPTPEVDAEVVAAFRAMLEGWTTPDERDAHVARLTRLLDGTR